MMHDVTFFGKSCIFIYCPPFHGNPSNGYYAAILFHAIHIAFFYHAYVLTFCLISSQKSSHHVPWNKLLAHHRAVVHLFVTSISTQVTNECLIVL